MSGDPLLRVRQPVRVVSSGVRLAPNAPASNPQQVSSYPRDGEDHIPIDAELFVVFDQPTSKANAIYEVADLDSTGLLSLAGPRYSTLGDTLFIKPLYPLRYGRPHGMRIDKIQAVDGTYSFDLPVIYFTTIARASVERVGTPGLYESVTLVPDRSVPVTIGVHETAGTAAYFDHARYRFYPADQIDLNSGFSIVPSAYSEVSIAANVGRKGSAAFTVPITLTRQQAAYSNAGLLGLEIVFDGHDETGLPYSFSASSRIRTNTFPGDSTLILTRAQLTPALGASISIGSVFLESPLPGATYVAGDTLRARAVVTGIGTGPFRGAFYMDGDLVMLVEGFLEAGRPDTVTTPGPLPSRRLGEHRLQFVVETPQNVPAAPITILCVAPEGTGEQAPKMRARIPAGPPATKRAGIEVDLGTLAQAKTQYWDADASAVYWSRSTAFAQLGKETRLEGNALWRVRLDDTQNGTGVPEQMGVKLAAKRGTAEWGDIMPSLAAGAPLFASTVPRRAAQATMSGGLGTLEGYVALESHPRSAGGVAREARSDLYAGRLSRALGSQLRLSAYGGYTHEDPTAGGVETATHARSVYGGSGTYVLPGGWRWLADVATVRHIAIEGVEPGRSRTGVRSELNGKLVGADIHAEGFHYQPDLVTELNPYAISDRQGVALTAHGNIKDMWRLWADYRFEKPVEAAGAVVTPLGTFPGVPSVSVERVAFGSGISLNQSSAVTPVLIRVRSRGDQTDLTETRFSSELTTAEAREGRTTVRFDVAIFDDKLGVGKKRKLLAATYSSIRRHPGNITSTTTIGYEADKHVDLNLSDQTFQGTFELRWDAVADRLAFLPYVVYTDRNQETRGVHDQLVSGRLQCMAMRMPALLGATLALEGRISHVTNKEPVETKDNDYGATLTLSGGAAASH
jgi:hypothetical protein